MCGIAGIIDFEGRPVNEGALRALTGALHHRGPDGDGFHLDGALGLGHRRLAIIDLDTGDQPMCNEDGSVWIVFNGEIYNFRELARELESHGHVLRTKSDTEVIVHAYEEWGTDCLRRLRGMFAFAIWDARKRELFLARDRVGIKPLVYVLDRNGFTFASELQALRALPGFSPTLDLGAVDLFLHFQYIPAPFTIYREAKKLPPAHYLVVREDGDCVGPVRYWDVAFEPDRGLTDEEWVERLDHELSEAVKLHLVSDVPFGAFLSGGVDSSTVVGYMSRWMGQPVKTFTIGFDDAAVDERPWAAEAATSLGAEHHVEVPGHDALGLLPELVRHYGEPFADSSSICTWLVSRSARRHVKMVLSGDGGDELFAGYGYYAKMLAHHPAPSGALRVARRQAGNLARRAGLLPPLPSPANTWYDRAPFFSDRLRLALWRPEHRYVVEGSRAWNDAQWARAKGDDLLSRCQYVDLHNYLAFDNLNKVDIASMAHGLEVRVPLLDHVLVETVARMPPELRLRPSAPGTPNGSNDSKYILRRLGARFFRDGFFDRTKMGFSVPIGRWVSEAGAAQVEESLMGPSSRLFEIFDAATVRQIAREAVTSSSSGHRVWALLFLQAFLEQNSVATA